MKTTKSHRLRACGVLAVVVFAGLNGSRAFGQAESLEQVFFVTRLGLTNPNTLLAADVLGSPEPELIITDVRGNFRLHSATTGAELHRFKLPGADESLTAPAIGDFTGDGRMEIAVGTGSGRVILLEASSFTVLGERQIGSAFSVQPTVITLADESAVLGLRDRLVLVDNDGTIHGVSAGRDGNLTEDWKYATRTAMQAPLVAGRVRSENRWDVVATTKDGYVYILDVLLHECENARRPDGLPAVEEFLVQQMSPILVSPLLVDTNGNRLDDVFVAMDKGEVVGFRYDRTRYPHLQRFGATSLRGAPVSPPVLMHRSGDLQGLYLFAASRNGVAILDARDLRKIAEDTTIFNGSNTAVGLIPRPNGLPEAAFGLKRTLTVTSNMQEWVAGNGNRPLTHREGRLEKSDLQNAVVVVMQPQGNQVLVVGMSGIDGGTLSGFRTTYTAGSDLWPNMVAWATHGGSGSQNSRLDLGAARLERDRRAHRTAEIAKWQAELAAAMNNSDWDSATDLVGRLIRADPTNRDYRALGKSVWFRSNLLAIISGVVAGLIFIGWSAWLIIRMVSFNRLRSMAESAFNRGDYDAARGHYARLVLRAGRNSRVPVAYARVLIAQHDYSQESLPIYAKAHALAPGDQEILHAYARALLLEPQTTAEAGRVYEQAMPSFPEPHLLEYGIGRVALASGQYEEAGKRLRAALRGGVTTPALYRALCETYIKTRNFTAKALPVFEQQFPSRMDDREFLEAYLMACIDGKRTDPQVETLCQSLLDLNPSFVPAYLHLATILLQKNQVGQAVEEVKSALNHAADDATAIAMLALCYLTQSRKDEEALHAYRRALRNQPDDKDLLRMLAAIFFERGSFDQEAVEIYHRSVEANPVDVTTLRALAQTAQLTNNGDLAIRSIEALAGMGQSNARLTIQLADAYVRKSVVDPKAERVLREALRQEPNNAEYLAALARVLAAQDRTDSDCIPVYESHLRNFKDDLAIGRQLAKAYIKADRYENALATTQRFLAAAPQDDELQRLNALASLYDNKIDEAVAEYQRILQRNAADPEALVNLALAYGQKLRVDDEAAALYQRALAIQPGNERLHLARARVMVSRNDLVAGVESYKAAIKARQGSEPAVIAHLTALLNEFPEVLRIRWFFVELLVSHGNLRDAIEQLEFINSNHPGQTNNILRALETILAKDGNNLAALLMRGQLLLASNQVDDAVRMLEKAYQLRPSDGAIIEKLTEAYNVLLAKKDSAEVRFRLGKLFHAQQEFDKAIGCFQKTAQDYRWEAESTKMLGKCFTSKGMLDLALQEFKKLVVDAETKELLYDLAQRYEAKRDLVGAKTVYRQLFAADINYKDVQTRFEMLSGSTSDPMAFEKTSIVQQMSEEAARRYELLDELGRGAMGIVYRARDKELEEVVALKILPDNMSNNPEAVRRFKIEARNARKLSHPHIVRIHDIGEEMGRKYISMEYVDGSDLKRKMKAAPNFRLPIPEVIKYAIQTADALAYAHRVGVVHRDIKPANIMLTASEDVKVTDFGIAKLMDGAGEGTMIGAVIGTPLYMSPEQVQGIPVDNRADIYAYGVMFYELLNGRPPFTEGDLAYQHIHKEPPVIEGIPAPLWDVVAMCLQKKKEDRWETAELIVEALKGLQKSGVV